MEIVENLKSRLTKKTAENKRLQNSLRYYKNIHKSQSNNTPAKIHSSDSNGNSIPTDDSEVQINVCARF